MRLRIRPVRPRPWSHSGPAGRRASRRACRCPGNVHLVRAAERETAKRGARHLRRGPVAALSSDSPGPRCRALSPSPASRWRAWLFGNRNSLKQKERGYIIPLLLRVRSFRQCPQLPERHPLRECASVPPDLSSGNDGSPEAVSVRSSGFALRSFAPRFSPDGSSSHLGPRLRGMQNAVRRGMR